MVYGRLGQLEDLVWLVYRSVAVGLEPGWTTYCIHFREKSNPIWTAE